MEAMLTPIRTNHTTTPTKYLKRIAITMENPEKCVR